MTHHKLGVALGLALQLLLLLLLEAAGSGGKETTSSDAGGHCDGGLEGIGRGGGGRCGLFRGEFVCRGRSGSREREGSLQRGSAMISDVVIAWTQLANAGTTPVTWDGSGLSSYDFGRGVT